MNGINVDAQVPATALSAYATNVTLDSTGVAAPYGFTVSGYGLGTATVIVGRNGDAFSPTDRGQPRRQRRQFSSLFRAPAT